MSDGKQSHKYTVNFTDEVHEQAMELLLMEGHDNLSRLISSLIRRRHHELQQKRFAMQVLNDTKENS